MIPISYFILACLGAGEDPSQAKRGSIPRQVDYICFFTARCGFHGSDFTS